MVHVAWLDCPAVGHRVAAYPCRTNRHRRNRMQWLLAISVLLLDRPTPPSRAERRGRSLPQHQRCLRARHDLQAIVELVRDQRVEVLALQETTEDFVKKLNEAGIEHYLPYAQVSSSDGVFGNGLWSATPLADPTDDDVNSSASFMPGGTVDMGGQQIRFVSVHTTAPVPGYWRQWKRSLDELGLMREHTDTRYIFMGDFNATYDHTPFRDFLGDRFVDAARESGHGFTFSWPTNRAAVPMFAGIDHVVLDQGMKAGQCKVVKVEGSDHAALLATVAVG